MQAIKTNIPIMLFIALVVPLNSSLFAAGPTVCGQVRYYSTIKSIGVEWDISGDTNHDAACAVRYRKQGVSAWNDFVPLFRVDFRGWYGADTADRAYNMLAGSVLFLEPATSYDVKLSLTDPDGGSKDTTLTIATRPVPGLPTGGQTLHAVPGTGGGDGSPANPFKGLAAAQSAARAGDIIVVHAGTYGNFNFSKSGSSGAALVWKAAGDGDAVFSYGRIIGSYIRLEGLKFVNSAAQTYALVGQSGSPSNVVTRCSFSGFNYSITMQSGSNDWYIADNLIVGDKGRPTGTSVDFEGEGIELEHTSGHTVCYNSISHVGDGVSYALRNCDIYGNDIFDVTDDGIEPDYGYANIRIWENRITNPHNHAFSLQPMFCGPWYIIRNQVVGTTNYVLKYRVADRLLLAHNTFVGWNTLDVYDQNVLSALSRNNLWIQAGGLGYIWEAMPCTESGSCTIPERWTPDYRTSVDYDGFDWGSSTPVFKWGNPVQRYSTLMDFVSAVGIETHALHVSRADLFDSLFSPGADSLYDRHCLTLKPGCAAIDKGDVLSGINQDFSGTGPDLGAYELNKPVPHYGVRPENNSPVRYAAVKPAAESPVTLRLNTLAAGHGIAMRVSIPDHGAVVACIYEVSGRQVAKKTYWTLHGQMLSLTWNGKVGGIYFLKLSAANTIYTCKFIAR
jgi:hypothetical protein